MKFVFRTKRIWILDTLKKINKFGKITIRKRKTVRRSKIEYLKNKVSAKELAERRATYFNTFYNFKINKITIRNQKTRWGSCSRAGNLNFSYKIALLPPELADYIVVHEICHLGEFNHSKDFWSLVEKTIPDYLECRKKLRNMGSIY